MTQRPSACHLRLSRGGRSSEAYTASTLATSMAYPSWSCLLKLRGTCRPTKFSSASRWRCRVRQTEVSRWHPRWLVRLGTNLGECKRSPNWPMSIRMKPSQSLSQNSSRYSHPGTFPSPSMSKPTLRAWTESRSSWKKQANLSFQSSHLWDPINAPPSGWLWVLRKRYKQNSSVLETSWYSSLTNRR